MFGLRRVTTIRCVMPKHPSFVTRIDHRAKGQHVALVLVHGFSGNAEATWSHFVRHLLADPSLQTWDMFSLGYASSLRVDVQNVWAADPNIETLARGLRTTLSLPPFDRYQCVAIAAHSMGGLVVQKAILDDGELSGRLSHVFLFGTPSNGLSKARPFAVLKRQVRDMAAGSAFITALRREWGQRFSSGMPFHLRVVAGDRDEFVPALSSLEPFPDEMRAVVPGNHLEIVKPIHRDHLSVTLVTSALCGRPWARGVVDGGRLAVEMGDFRAAVDALLPRADALDDAALGSLALALDGLGRGKEALDVLERCWRGGRVTSTDALGILAGRIKRRWLLERAAADLFRAKDLYADGLHRAEAVEDHYQASYHAINFAFLDLMSSPANSGVSGAVRSMAECARDHSVHTKQTHWTVATQGEACLMLEDLNAAETFYARAIAMTESPRHIHSMYLQAVRVAARVFGETGANRIEQLFDVPSRDTDANEEQSP